MPNSQKSQRDISKDGRNVENSTLQERTQMTFQEISSNSFLTYSEKVQIKISFGDEKFTQRFNQRFRNNKITTTKYNIITWVPKSLLLQFRRIANIYFLIISIFTCFSFSPKNPVTMIGTFAMVLIFTMCKEGYEDIKRYKQDKEVNLKEVTYFNRFSNKFEKKLSQDIRVGDLIQVKNEEYIPADILLLKSSLDTGLCFVDSMNLDGETNLKEKMVPPGLNNISIEKMIISSGFIICEKPNDNLESWESSIYFQNEKEQLLCGLKQLLIKGCKLKNTESAIGVVVYTGHNTKIMKNSKTPPVKVSNLMKTMNKLLYSVFIFQILLCILFALGNKIWKDNILNLDIKINKNSAWYLPNKQDAFCVQFLTFLVAYSHLIPISLYVALEIVKLIQSVLIYYDSKIYDKFLNKPSIARTSDLIEELGQVEIIFSDKTGTLTKNEMEFRKCSVNNNIYGDVSCSLNSFQMDSKAKNTINGDPKAYNILISPPAEHSEDKQKLTEFFTICSVCHSAYISEKNNNKTFHSSSPDEVALLQGAAQMGFSFNKRTSEGIETISPIGEVQFWNLHMELPFDSIRKRMSVIVTLRNQGNGLLNSSHKIYYLFTKGADSAMLSKMSLDEENLSQIKSK
jgi:phospholipid-transporting ATPase